MYDMEITVENQNATIRTTRKNLTAEQVETAKRSIRAKAGHGSTVDFKVAKK